jgi:hypothetical protein
MEKSSESAFKEVMNHVLWRERVMAFDPEEWGELAEFQGLQEKLLEASKIEIERRIDGVGETVSGLANLFARLEKLLSEGSANAELVSMERPQFEAHLQELRLAYLQELEIRRRIFENLKSMRYIQAPYDVIVAITAMWSGKAYINDRAIGHVEKFLEHEASQGP